MMILKSISVASTSFLIVINCYHTVLNLIFSILIVIIVLFIFISLTFCVTVYLLHIPGDRTYGSYQHH